MAAGGLRFDALTLPREGASSRGNPLRVLTYVAAVLLVVAWWQRDALPPPSRLDDALLAEPVQLPTDRAPFRTTVGGIEYTIRPLFTYDLHGLVVSKHDSDDWWDVYHKFWNDRINVADLCVVWGGNAAHGRYQPLRFSNLSFSCWVQNLEKSPQFEFAEWSNNHLLSDDPAITRTLARVRAGDQVHFRGYLVQYAHNHDGGFFRGTSTTRTDQGNFSCETVYATDLEIVRPGNTGWRITFWIALAMLVATLVTRLVRVARGTDEADGSP